MNKVLFKKVFIIVSSALCAFIITMFIINYLLNKYSIPDKKVRIHNLKEYSGINDLTELDASDISHDIDAALSKYTNWDNLFLSEHFKSKYKNRKNILDDVAHITDISSGLDYEHGEDVVVIYAEKKHAFFDTDESDDITTEYYFRYILNESGEIDDLILLEKRDVYTINGEPVTAAAKS